MRLCYFESKNFGDALNPYIFSKLLPNFFDQNQDVEFCGIGSILGLDILNKESHKIIFSSGFAYGKKPNIDPTYNFFCVRGPLTAKALNLNKKLSVADGAILVPHLGGIDFHQKKTYKVSFMPHWESTLKFNWEFVCKEAGVHYIDPLQDCIKSLNEIIQSEQILAEAMHAAIIADALRIPWIPVKAYKGINEFKWLDWTSSLNLEYSPHFIPSLYNNTPFVRNLFVKKISKIPSVKFYGGLINAYQFVQRKTRIPETIKTMISLKESKTYLSNETILSNKTDQLLDILSTIKMKYKE